MKTLQEISHGPGFTMWIAFALFAVISIINLTGHGANLIAGYNTASKETKDKYDTKKMCRVMGIGMAVVAVLIFVMAVWQAVLPAWFAYLFLAVILVDCTLIIVLLNTKCRK